MLCSRVELVVVCLVLLSQSIASAPSNPSQVSQSSQHGNLHQNEETVDGMFPSPSDDEGRTPSSAGSFEEHQENRKSHSVAGGSLVSPTGPGGSPLFSDSSSTSTPQETTEPFSISSRKSLSGTTPTDSKSHSEDSNINDRDGEGEDDQVGTLDSRNNEFDSAAEDSSNKSDKSSTTPTSTHSLDIIKDKIAAGDASGQNTEEEQGSTSSSSETFTKNKLPPQVNLHRIPLNRSNVMPAQFLLPPPPQSFVPPSESQEFHSDEKERVSGSHSGSAFSGAESNEKEGDFDPSGSNPRKCTPFSRSRGCSPNGSSSSEENPTKQEEVDVVLIPGDLFRPPTILIIDTIITETNSTENSGEDNGNYYSEENGSSATTIASVTAPTIIPSAESLEDVSPGIVEKLNSQHDALNGTIPHDSRLNDKKGSPERNETSGLHLRPWFINHEPKHSNGSSGTSPTTTTNTPLDFDRNSPFSSIEKISPISPAGDSSNDNDASSSTPNSDEDSITPSSTNIDSSSSTDITTGEDGNGEQQKKPQTSSPIVSRSEGPLNRRRRDSIFSHLPNNSSRSQSVTHSAENNSSSSSQESNNGGNSTSASNETDEMDSNGNATTGKDTIHIFLEVLHLEPIPTDDSGEQTSERNSSPTNPHHNNSPSSSSPTTSTNTTPDTDTPSGISPDNSASDGSPDSTSNQNSTSSTSHSHRVVRRESHSVSVGVPSSSPNTPSTTTSHGPSSTSSGGGSSIAVGGTTAGKSNPSPSPATTSTSTTHSPASQAKQSPPPAAGKPTSTAATPKPITSNKPFELPPLLNVQQH